LPPSFGTVGACGTYPDSLGWLDLRGTPFSLSAASRFKHSGGSSTGSSTYTAAANNGVVSFRTGCQSVGPWCPCGSGGYGQLVELAGPPSLAPPLAPPAVSVILVIPASDFVVTITEVAVTTPDARNVALGASVTSLCMPATPCANLSPCAKSLDPGCPCNVVDGAMSPVDSAYHVSSSSTGLIRGSCGPGGAGERLVIALASPEYVSSVTLVATVHSGTLPITVLVNHSEGVIASFPVTLNTSDGRQFVTLTGGGLSAPLPATAIIRRI
jgi:hypothetical protein